MSESRHQVECMDLTSDKNVLPTARLNTNPGPFSQVVNIPLTLNS